MPRIDYDAIAHLYDEPSRDHVADRELASFLGHRSPASGEKLQVLDIGCGTGKQVGANRARWPAITLIGLDRFRGMLRIATKRCPDARWTQGDGAALPFASEQFDYVTNQYSYPHVGDTPGLITEIFRVLRPGGRFVMTSIDPWSMPGWFIYRYFPEAQARDHRDFLPVTEFTDLMHAAAGFVEVAAARVDDSREETLERFRAFARARHRTSQLLAISDEGYADGLQRLDRAMGSAPQDRGRCRSEFVRVTIRGDRPKTEQPGT